MSRHITQAALEAALPDVTSTLRLPGLQQPVDIYRDQWGIPHIRATSEPDAFLAQGFVTAQDRLWHIDYDRQRALGRWAEWAGPLGVAEDRLMRTFGLERAARADLAVTSPAARAMLTAHTAGINALLATTRTLPIEYTLLDVTPEPWEDWHSLAVYKLRNMLMGTYEMKLWRARVAVGLGPERAAALFQEAPAGGLVTVPPGATYDGPALECLDELAAVARQLNWLRETDGGSNAWVLGGERTASGLPLVAGDSHRAVATRHGPIIAGQLQAGTGLAFSHTGTQHGTPWLDSVYQLLLARSADELAEAMRKWTEPVNNVVYADVHGAYGYRYRG